MDKATQQAIRHSKYIASSMEMIHNSIRKQFHAPVDRVCSQCKELKPCTPNMGAPFCDDCHQAEVGE